MASIRKRRGKWQVQIRRTGHGAISKTFTVRKDALEWARDAERQADIPESKNGEARTIPLSKSAISVLGDLPTGKDRVFPISANSLKLAWKRVLKRAGITDLHFHDLRHEAISRLFEQGLTVPEVALISGHKDARQLFVYAHAVRQSILQKLDGIAMDHKPARHESSDGGHVCRFESCDSEMTGLPEVA